MGTTHSENAISGTRDTVDPKFLEAMERLDACAPQKGSPRPDAFTAKDAAAKWDVTRWCATLRLQKMAEKGELEHTEVKNGKPTYYWFKE